MQWISRTATAAAVAIVASVAANAHAGFIASTEVGTYSYSAPGSISSPAAGGQFTVSNLGLATFTPDTAADPQISGGDLDRFLLSLDLVVGATPTPTAAGFRTAGTYDLSYDLNGNGSIDVGEPRVSSGAATLNFTQAFSGFDVLAGTLTQILGPSNPAFADLAYGNNANIVLQGGFINTANSSIALNLTQQAVAPEPATLAAVAGLGGLAIRRRRCA